MSKLQSVIEKLELIQHLYANDGANKQFLEQALSGLKRVTEGAGLVERLEKARQELLQYAGTHPDDTSSAYDLINHIGKSKAGTIAFGHIGHRYVLEYFDIAQAAINAIKGDDDDS